MSINRRHFLRGAAAGAGLAVLPGCGAEKIPRSDMPQSSFDEDSTAEDVTEGLDLKGKVAVVTGCTSGIGYETMRVLSLRGATVAGTSRSLERATEACRSVSGPTIPLRLDLGDPQSCVDAAMQIRSANTPIDMLICNAGYRGGGNDRELINGVEKHLAINHLGHFIFVNRLLDKLYLSWQGRIVVVASRASYRDVPEEGIRFDDLKLTDDYSDRMAYAHSKLANVLFAHGLARRLKGTRITANSLHPGVINTEIDRNVNKLMQLGFAVIAGVTGKNVEEGAATSCFVATHPSLGATSGEYFEDCNAVRVEGAFHYDVEMSDRLWAVSEELTREYIVTHQRPDEEEGA